MRVRNLQEYGLTESSFRRLNRNKVYATIQLRTYDVTSKVRQLPPSLRHSYLTTRVNRWIRRLRLNYPRITFRIRGTEPTPPSTDTGSSLPQSINVCCSSREILDLAAETAVA